MDHIRDSPLLNVDIFDSVLPVDCMLGGSFSGPYAKLLLYFSLPFVGGSIILTLAAIAALCRPAAAGARRLTLERVLIPEARLVT